MNRSKDFTEEEFLKRYGTPKPKRFSYSFGDVVRVLANNRVLNGLRAVVCADHEGGGRFPTYVEGHAVVWFDITEVEPLDAAEDTAEQLANLKKENEGLKHQIDVVCGYEMDKDIEAIGLREELAACKAEITKQSLSFDLLQAEANELSDTMTRQINEIMALDAEIERLRERVVVWHPLDEQEPPEARVYGIRAFAIEEGK